MIKFIVKWTKKYRLHFLVWLLFIVYEILLIGIRFNAFGHPLTYAVHYAIIIAYFYTVSRKAIPYSLSSRKLFLIRLPVSMGILFVLYVSVNFVVDTFLIKYEIMTHVKSVTLDQDYILGDLYRCLYFCGFATAYYFIETYLNEKKNTSFLEEQRILGLIKEEKMARMLVKAQNDFLRAQINPHFLFNTLNFIYNNIKINPEEAGEAIIVLSEIMRFSIKSREDELILLGEEMEQVKQLLYLYQLRKDYSENVDLYIAEDAVELKFVPLVLLTLMENIFKHGNLSLPEHTAVMAVFVAQDSLHICTNNLAGGEHRKSDTNNGLKNIRDRIRSIYGLDTEFSYGLDTENHFLINIVVPLHKLTSPGEKKPVLTDIGDI